jgi:tRNA pseudouridine38-40 synthase
VRGGPAGGQAGIARLTGFSREIEGQSTAMRTLKLTLAYDGTRYGGWQRQINAVTVQQIVEEAVAPVAGTADVRPPTVSGAGRTDAGVHALGQVASVNIESDIPASAVHRALNVRLPADIRVVGVVDAPLGFHARFHATGKAYRYRICTTPVASPFDRWFVWHAPFTRDLDAMRVAAGRLVGRHDFASFQSAGSFVRHTVRTISRIDIRDLGGELVVEVEGDGFLRHMVRAMVGTLSEVGTGARTPEEVDRILAARDRRAAGPTAPAAGLTLLAVRY